MKQDGAWRELRVVLNMGWDTAGDKDDKLGVLFLQQEYINMYYKPWMHEYGI